MNKTLRERILEMKGLASCTEVVPEFEGIQLELRELTGAQRLQYQESVKTEEGQVVLAEYYATALVLGAYDPETGERVFTLEDREALYEKGFMVIERLGKKILSLSGIGRDAETRMEKN